jgi:purine-nucleoside phosphorylase
MENITVDDYNQMVLQSVAFLKQKIADPPVVGILTGTGLGESVAALKSKFTINYTDIPNFPISTVHSHAGQLHYGYLGGKATIVLKGRFHLYEGYQPVQITFPIRIMQALGVRYLILTNASGGLNLAFSAGDIMLIKDHINLTGENPLIGPNNDNWGLRFPDMTHVYNRKILSIATKYAESAGLPIHRGVYAGLTGPSLETPSEMRYLRTIGADAVGFSTVMEAIVGVHAGMHILGVSTITNINDPDHPAPATMEAIIKVAQKAAEQINGLIEAVVKGI